MQRYNGVLEPKAVGDKKGVGSKGPQYPVGLCTLNQVDPSTITYSLSNP